MKNNKSYAYSILGILFIILNVIIFTIPINKTTTFWITYVFTLIAFGMQILIWKVAFNKTETLKSKYLGIPVIYIGILYLIIQMIALAISIIVSTIPTWIAIIINVLIIGISMIYMITTELGKNIVKNTEQKVNQKIFYIKELQTEVEMIAQSEEDNEIKVELEKLAENIRYSDPISNERLVSIEDEISSKVSELKNATKDKKDIIKEINLMIIERNKKCKINKE